MSNEDSIRDLVRQGKYEEAIVSMLQLLRNQPEDNYLMYVLAGIYSLAGDVQKSLQSLEKAVEMGFDNYIGLSHDHWYSNFKRLDSLQEYRNLVTKIREQIAIRQREKSIVIKEGEWTDISMRHRTDKFPSTELSLSYDIEALRIKAVVHDVHFKDGDRSWRYGDGFFINFVMPSREEHIDSNRFYGFGFSLEMGKPLGILVSRHGTYPFTRLPEITPDIKVDLANQEAYYRINIPWSILHSFKPLLDERAGINIIYTSQNDDRTRKRISWVEDPYFDAEEPKTRRFAPLYFDVSEKSGLQFAAELENRLLDKTEAGLNLVIYSPENRESCLKVSVYDSDRQKVAVLEKLILLEKGKTRFSERITLDTDKSDMYSLEAILNDTISWTETFFKLGAHELEHLEDIVHQLHELGSQPLVTSSIFGLRYRLGEIRELISEFHVRDNPEDIQKRISELCSLIEECRKNGSLYKAGYLRTAFRSPVDNSLQPYSLVLPESFDQQKTYDLILGLHGSGVDEVNFIKWMGGQYSSLNMIIVGPRGRGLSDSYIGQSEQDVIDVLQTVKNMFNIRKTFLCGFSMGGFGAWYISFRHPQYFDGVAVISGRPFAPLAGDGVPEHDMRNYVGKAKNLPYLVIHGTEDRSVDIRYTDEFVESLKKADYNLQYIREEGAGHGNIETSKYVVSWLEKLRQVT